MYTLAKIGFIIFIISKLSEYPFLAWYLVFCLFGLLALYGKATTTGDEVGAKALLSNMLITILIMPYALYFSFLKDAPRENRIAEDLTHLRSQGPYSDAVMRMVLSDWGRAPKRYLNGWKRKDIGLLREMVWANYLMGMRKESYGSDVAKRFGLSESVAREILKNEIRFLSSKLKEYRARESGSPGYIWRCVKGSRKRPVRPIHKALDGCYFDWDNPPVINEFGDRGHPGDDEECRCSPEIVFNFKANNKKSRSG